MIARLAISFLLGSALYGATPVVYPDFLGCCYAPVFINGYLFHMPPDGTSSTAPPRALDVYGPGGISLYQVSLTAPDGTPARLNQQAVAVDTDGTVAVGMWYGPCCAPPHRDGGAIVFLSPQGAVVRTVRTGLYEPRALTFAPDHSLWSLGYELDSRGFPVREYQAVRQFSAEGVQMGAFLPRSSLPKGLDPGQGLSFMRSATDRIGMLTWPGMLADTPIWLELDFKGNVVARLNLKSNFGLDHGGAHAYAYTKDGRIYAQSFDPAPKQMILWTWDRTHAAWAKVAGPDMGSILEGADGNSLVFRTARSTPGLPLLWYSAP